MRTLRAETADAIASNLNRPSVHLAGTDQTTGGVYCLERNWECVPFKLGGQTFVLEFQTPYFLTEVLPYNEILFKTKSGGYFVPKLEFRFLNTSYFTADHEVTQLCAVPTAEITKDVPGLADAMRNALIVYYRSYPNANQYFYMFDENTKQLLDKVLTDIPPALEAKYAFERYLDLADPYGGFSLTSKSL